MKAVKSEATTDEPGGFPCHYGSEEDGMLATISQWEFEPDDWDRWERSRDRLITLAAYPDGTWKMIASMVRKVE